MPIIWLEFRDDDAEFSVADYATANRQIMADNYTPIPWRGKPASECPDGHRYKAIGDSKAIRLFAG